ncbi:MAG: SWIM zinc finger family protein [Oscillospiraceae bacterium]|nr:SWIM zinc finger family protein [Oscillospiraceae bacterium]
MGLLNLASSASQWRGYDYYKAGKVKSYHKTDDDKYEGQVNGSDGACYQVKIDLAHPRSSQCNCPHAAGKRIVCKHMVALYFHIFPKEAENFYREVIEAAEKAEEEQEQLEFAVIDYVEKMNKVELQQAFLQMLFEGPDWQFERFVRYNLREYDGLFE